MKAIDTNILARYVIGDDPEQTALATQVLSEPCFVPDTVLLEAAWLLASRFGMKRAVLVETFRDLLALPDLRVSDPLLIGWAIERFAQGADFADMMHIVGARGADCFLSFERSLAKQAGAESPLPVGRPGEEEIISG